MVIARRSISRIKDQDEEISPVTPSQPTTFDQEEIKKQLSLLLDLLGGNDLDSEACLAEIRQNIGHLDEIEKEINLADSRLQQLDFQAAAFQIKEIVSKLNL
jgi:hypothetical protein